MALYTMADLHLSFSTAKPMDVFGDRWKDHPEKIAQRWQLTDQDTIVLPGDFSWAIDLNELRADMAFLDALPGKKILSKGNHDYWWETMAKLNRFIADYPSVSFLHNNSYTVCGAGICGTRGWTLETSDEDEKVLNREVGRLRTSLQQAKAPPIVFLHYPPIFGDLRCEPILEVMKQFGVTEWYYGHLHGAGAAALAFEGESDGITFRLISADHLDFSPVKIRE